MPHSQNLRAFATVGPRCWGEGRGARGRGIVVQGQRQQVPLAGQARRMQSRYDHANGNDGEEGLYGKIAPLAGTTALTSWQIPAETPHYHSDIPIYTVTIRQGPSAGLSFGGNASRRKPLEPPLIAQLDIQDQHGNEIQFGSENQHFLLASLTLFDATSGAQADLVRCGDGMCVTVLEGKLASQRTTARDLDGSTRSFFVFPDVSVRVDGQFRLMVSVLALDPIAVLDPHKSAGTVVASGLTDVFTVFDATPSAPVVDGKALTPLTLHLRSQGIPI